MPKDDIRKFFLFFDTVHEFGQGFERSDGQMGVFFQSTRALLGQAALIRVAVRSMPLPIFLEGVVALRRLKSAGPDLPPGVVINLTDRDRSRVDGIVGYHASKAENKDRRETPRIPVFASAKYKTAKGEFQAQVRSLSEGGAFLRCQGPLISIGAPLDCTLFLGGEDVPGVSMTGRVAWIDMFDSSKGLGVMFDPGQRGLVKVGKHIELRIKDLQRQAK